jgi:hypothetical protein
MRTPVAGPGPWTAKVILYENRWLGLIFFTDEALRNVTLVRAAATFAIASSLLLAGFGSVSGEFAVAVLASLPICVSLTTTVISALSPEAKRPREQVRGSVLEQVPLFVETLTRSTGPLRVSVTLTSVAGSGPRLLTEIR